VIDASVLKDQSVLEKKVIYCCSECAFDGDLVTVLLEKCHSPPKYILWCSWHVTLSFGESTPLFPLQLKCSGEALRFWVRLRLIRQKEMRAPPSLAFTLFLLQLITVSLGHLPSDGELEKFDLAGINYACPSAFPALALGPNT